MNILIINNQTRLLDELKALCAGHELEAVEAPDVGQVDPNAYDLIVLSGGYMYSAMYHQDYFAAELELIRTTKTPIIGVCLGLQLIVVAYGGRLVDAGRREARDETVKLTEAGRKLFGEPDELQVSSSHRWSAVELPAELETLATSQTGVEILRHRTRPMFGLQFHPESVNDTGAGRRVFETLLKSIAS
jgi:GMP synthase-like glutamine amidotransferase